jgi:hypothetical protein
LKKTDFNKRLRALRQAPDRRQPLTKARLLEIHWCKQLPIHKNIANQINKIDNFGDRPLNRV